MAEEDRKNKIERSPKSILRGCPTNLVRDSEIPQARQGTRPFQTPAFSTEHPWRKRVQQRPIVTDEVVEDAQQKKSGPFREPISSDSKRVGPFFKPRELTPEEKAEKAKQREANKAKLQLMMMGKNYDKYTILIATILGVFSFGLAKFYLKWFQLWNSAIVECVGLVIYDLVMIAFGVPMALVTYVTVVAVPMSFLCKFIIYKFWMFRKVESIKPPTK